MKTNTFSYELSYLLVELLELFEGPVDQTVDNVSVLSLNLEVDPVNWRVPDVRGIKGDHCHRQGLALNVRWNVGRQGQGWQECQADQ